MVWFECLFPSKSHLWESNPQCDDIKGRAFGRGLSHEGGTVMSSISALVEKA